jgi:hypothetical protein
MSVSGWKQLNVLRLEKTSLRRFCQTFSHIIPHHGAAFKPATKEREPFQPPKADATQ